MIRSQGETNWKSMQVAQTKWEWGMVWRREEGGGLQPSQGKEWRVRTLKRRGNLVPAVLHPPPPLHSLFIVHKWAGINSFNLELNVLTLPCLSPTPGHWLSPFYFTHLSLQMQPLTPTVRRPVWGYHLGGVRVNSLRNTQPLLSTGGGQNFRKSNADKPVVWAMFSAASSVLKKRLKTSLCCASSLKKEVAGERWLAL